MLPAGIVALGLVHGSLAGLNGLGLVLLWRTTRVVNLAQPSLGLVGGVLTGMLVASAGWSFWWAAPVGLATGAVLGLGAERIVLRRLADAPRAVLLVATVGLAQVFGALGAGLPLAFGGPLPSYTIHLGFDVDLFPVRLLGPHLLALAALPVTAVAVHLFLHRSRLGLAASALGQNAERARALGVPAGAVRALVWAVAGAIGSVSGVLAIPVLGYGLGTGIAPAVLLLALAPAVLAGLRSIGGTVAASLAIGVAYQAGLWWSPRAGVADLLLAGVVLAAVAVRRGRVGRADVAARASSWDAAATPRPLPWTVTRRRSVRAAMGAGTAAAAAAAALVPAVLSPGDDVLYATSAALALGALAVAVAWMFAGEIALGHWGLAGLGAAVAAVVPGPWAAGTVLAAATIGTVSAVYAYTSFVLAGRRRTPLAYAVAGLAIAVAAPVVVLTVGRHAVPAEPGPVGAAAAALAVLAAAGVTLLRRSRAGARMIAVRDDPDRARWLGAAPARAFVAALGTSGALAGAAGALYIAATPAGVAPGAFDAARSLDVLAMAVVGGLGSPAGALLGAGALQASRLTLPGVWASLTSGAGVLLVVLFLPAGLGRALTTVRDAVLLRPPRVRAGRPIVRGAAP